MSTYTVFEMYNGFTARLAENVTLKSARSAMLFHLNRELGTSYPTITHAKMDRKAKNRADGTAYAVASNSMFTILKD